jgi:hypothetical protein
MAKEKISIPKHRIEEWGLAVLIITVVGWFAARAYQQYVSGGVVNQPNNPNIPVPTSALSQNQGYYWPGTFGGSSPGAISNTSTNLGGLTGLTIPPGSPVTLPPVSAPFSAASPASTVTGLPAGDPTSACCCR